jgi:hypothetical protein
MFPCLYIIHRESVIVYAKVNKMKMLIKEQRVSDLNPIYALATVTGWYRYRYHTTKLDLCSHLIYLKTFEQEAVQTWIVLSPEKSNRW